MIVLQALCALTITQDKLLSACIVLSCPKHTRILNFLKVGLEKVHNIYFKVVLGRASFTEDRAAFLENKGSRKAEEINTFKSTLNTFKSAFKIVILADA